MREGSEGEGSEGEGSEGGGSEGEGGREDRVVRREGGEGERIGW